MVGGRARGRNSVSITKHRIHGVKAGPSREKILFILWIFHPETHESHLPSAQRSPVQPSAAQPTSFSPGLSKFSQLQHGAATD